MRIGWKPKSHDSAIASVRFRCLTPLRALQAQAYPIELYDPGRTDYNAVIFSKLYGAGDQALARQLKERGALTILDLSDNHFYNPENLPAYIAAGRDLRRMLAIVDGVICCSDALADVVQIETGAAERPLVVGDAVEAFELPRRSARGLSILWFGSHGSPNAPAGMEDILRVRGELERSAKAGGELVVVSNNAEKFAHLSQSLPIAARYREWNADSFAEELSAAACVIVPVTPNPFTHCKSNNRVATALWHGVPVLADSIPAYEELRDVAVLDDWRGGFDLVVARAPELLARTHAGQAFVRKHFNEARVAAQWRSAIDHFVKRAASVTHDLS